MPSKTPTLSRLTGLLLALATTLLPALDFEFDFNSLSLGNLNRQDDDSPNRIAMWSRGSFVPQVISGNLIPPSTTNYSPNAGGSPQRIQVTRDDDKFRAQFHQVSPINGGVVWVSALLKAESLSAAAVSFDGSNENDETGYMMNDYPGFGVHPNAASGSTEVFWSDNLADFSNNQSVTLQTDFSSNAVLILARLDLDEAANNVRLWVNPTLSDISELPAPTLTATTFTNSINWLGIGAVNAGRSGYLVEIDNLFLSSNAQEVLAYSHVTGVTPEPSSTTLDLNRNGLPDEAELLFPALSDLPLNGDADGDGASNQAEAIAGTDPFDPTSVLQISPSLSFPTLAGKRYQAEISETLAAESWSDFGPVISGNDNYLQLNFDLSNERRFIRVKVLPDLDTDRDGLGDRLENYLGYNPTDSSSVRRSAAGGDYQQFASLMRGGNSAAGMAGTDQAGIPSDEQASRFLAQASWGPTTESIAQLRGFGPDSYRKWIDQQVALPPNFTRTYMDYLAARRDRDLLRDRDSLPHFIVNNSSFAFYRENLNSGWMRIALFGDDQLRQRVAWSLSQVVVIGPRCNSFALAAADWYDKVIQHSLGSYRDLLYDISVHPWMGWWLSHIGNEKAAQVDTTPDGIPVLQLPDENYAREIMQLFSIGLWELNLDGTRKLDAEGQPIPTYTNEDIAQVARVFTGLKAKAGTSGRDMYSAFPMRMSESTHDTGNDFLAGVYQRTIEGVPEPLSEAGKKRFLGHELPRFQDDPGRSGLDDINDAIDIFFNHPNCPPFVCRNLIQHLVTSNPTPAYLERIATVFVDDGTGTRGNLAAVVKAILLDPEARDLATALDSVSGRLKGPVLRTVHLARATKAGDETPQLFNDQGIQFWDPKKDVMFADYLEYPFESPSVFNFYEPGFSRSGEIRDNNLLSPEFQIMNSLTTTTVPNRLLYFIQDGFHRSTKNAGVTPDFEADMAPYESLSQTGTEALVDHLGLIFSHGMIEAETRSELINRVNTFSNSSSNADDRAELALYLSLISAEGAVLK